MTITKGRLRPQMSPMRAAATLAVATLGAAADALVGWPLRVIRARRLMGELAQMGEHGLRDIGLSVQDVRDAAGLPPGGDPATLLCRRARERRHADLAHRATRPGAGRR